MQETYTNSASPSPSELTAKVSGMAFLGHLVSVSAGEGEIPTGKGRLNAAGLILVI